MPCPHCNEKINICTSCAYSQEDEFVRCPQCNKIVEYCAHCGTKLYVVPNKENEREFDKAFSRVFGYNVNFDTKICPKCGQEIGDVPFCPFCGNDLTDFVLKGKNNGGAEKTLATWETYEEASLGTKTYKLKTSTTTDEEAYNNAMNEYIYEKASYDHKIEEINAKIAILQQQDKNLELKLKQLDTEENAIQTEIDAVKKVISKNVESSFKTFNA